MVETGGNDDAIEPRARRESVGADVGVEEFNCVYVPDALLVRKVITSPSSSVVLPLVLAWVVSSSLAFSNVLNCSAAALYLRFDAARCPVLSKVVRSDPFLLLLNCGLFCVTRSMGFDCSSVGLRTNGSLDRMRFVNGGRPSSIKVSSLAGLGLKMVISIKDVVLLRNRRFD